MNKIRALNGPLVAAALILFAYSSWGGTPALATEPRKIFSPIVEEGEYELESVGTIEHDPKKTLNGGQAYTLEAGYGVTDFWSAELEGEFKSDPGGDLRHTATGLENIFELTPQGGYWLDLGFLAEYEIAALKGSADEVIFGPIAQKEFGDWLATLNLFFDKQVGAYSSGGTALRYGVQLRYRWQPWLEPAIEAYGEPGPLFDFDPGDEQTHQIGPVLTGTYRMSELLGYDTLPGKLKYEVGYLFGLTPGTAQGAVKWRFEYEFRF